MRRNRSYQSRTPRQVGAIYLKTPSQLALWDHELTGQISDGCWENSRPFGHYEFWCRLERKLDREGTPRVETPCQYAILRRSYGFSKLYFFDEVTQTRPVQDRMVNLGRLALACDLLGADCGYEQRIAAEEMPATHAEYLARLNAAPGEGKAEEERQRFLKAVDSNLAYLYYFHPQCQAYGVKQMKADVKVIAGAMKNLQSPAGE